MTPKQLHDEWCSNWPDCPGGCGFDKDIAAAIRAAVEAEREAARAVIKVVRWAVENHYAPPPLCDVMIAYDAAVKANRP